MDETTNATLRVQTVCLLILTGLALSAAMKTFSPVLIPFVLAILMVSRLSFPKAGLRDNMAFNVFQVVNIALIFYCGITRTWPEYLFSIGVLLLVGGIIAGRFVKTQAAQA